MEYIKEINNIIAKTDSLIKNLFFSLSPIYKDQFGIDQDAAVFLFTTLHSTSESILILLLNQAIFDADVLLRTVMEGTAKYCYLMTGSKQERHDKYMEYKYKLTEIDKLLDHFKAIETIKILKKYSSNSTKPFELSVLTENEANQLKSLYPAKVRNEIKGRWSYQSLLRSLADTHPEYKAQLGSFSTYSLTSHFGHFDWTGVSMRESQIMSSSNEDDIIFDVAHAIRIASNLLSFYIFRVSEYMRGNNIGISRTAELSMETITYIDELINMENIIIESVADEDI